jgi:hypothetical protein
MMSAARIRNAAIWLTALALFLLLLYRVRTAAISLETSEFLTGYWLFGLIAFLAMFNLRKRLAMLPLGSAANWLRLHVAGGMLALAIYWLHTAALWPIGVYEQILAGLFYAVVVTGIAGYGMQRFYPRRLTQTGVEVIFERVPREIADIREAAERLVLECTETTGSDTLGKHYVDTLDWFFRRPRFLRNHAVGSQRADHWIRQQDAAVRRYLADDERPYLDRLTALAIDKSRIDVHYALQGLMKRWLLIHVPLTSALVAMAIWHFILVHVYAR